PASTHCGVCSAPIGAPPTGALPTAAPTAPLPAFDGTRWQYAVASIGTFSTGERLVRVLGALGADGWELVNVYDKASNWLGGTEKGFILFKRAVGPGEQPIGGLWAVEVDKTGTLIEPSTQAW